MVHVTDESVAALLSVQQLGMLDYLTTQCRCLKFYDVWMSHVCWDKFLPQTEDTVSSTEVGATVIAPWGTKRIWMVAEDNIKVRRGARGVAT